MLSDLQLKQHLDSVASLDVSPGDAINAIRGGLGRDDRDGADATYDAMRSATWRLLTSRTYGDEIEEWLDLFKQTSALFDARNFVDLGQKMNALVDLALESARFGIMHSHEQIVAKQHVLEVLKAIGSNGARKAEVMKETGLKQANLSRILANLAAVGLIDRKSLGKEASFSLSPAGKDLLVLRDEHPRGGSGLDVRPARSAR